MPPKRRSKKSDDGYRWALPGGDEMSALGTGISRAQTERAIQGISTLKTVANERLLMAQNQWYLADRYGVLIPTSEKRVVTTYLDDLQAAQTRHQKGLETVADELGTKRPDPPVLADGGTKGQLGRIYKILSQRNSRASISPKNWQDGAVTLRQGGPEPLLLLHKPVKGGSFFSGRRIPSPLKMLRP